ncbi:hypothetical protein [Dyadobacter tibetensis]|uniref:hypothetical protein n=1 Tax=Dyadobacter tibetensis TaxID=1211851 RepID=UPI0004BBE5E5|nr:hypothetical protein [Dyadobacter tibetensis]
MLCSTFILNPLFPQYVMLVILLFVLFGLSHRISSLHALRSPLALVLMVVPVFYFFLLLWTHTSTVPFTDDYNLFETISKLHRADGWQEYTSALFEQVNQHRFAFERIVMLILFYSTGTVHLPTLIILGNLAMVGILFLFYKTLLSEKIHWYFFIPVPYILFNLVYSENAFWGIAAIQNTPLILMAFITVYGLSLMSRGGYVLALISAIVTTFISGSGLLVWVIGVLFLVYQKSYRGLVVWVVLATAIVFFYFTYDYTIIQSESESVLKHPIYNLLLLWGFWGNALYLNVPHPLVSYFHPDMVWCAILGFIFTIILLFWLLRLLIIPRLHWSYYFLLGAIMFIMGTGAMFVLSRPSAGYFMHGGAILSRRYMIFGVVLMALMYLCVLIMLKNMRKGFMATSILTGAGMLLLHFHSYYSTLVDVRKQYAELDLDGYYWREHHTYLTQGYNYGDVPFWNHPTRMKELMSAIEADGVSKVKVPEEIEALLRFAQTKNATRPFPGQFQVRSTMRTSWDNQPDLYLTLEAQPLNKERLQYFVLKNGKQMLLLPAIPVPNNWVTMLSSQNYYSEAYSYGLFRIKLPKGSQSYQVWLVTEHDGAQTYWNTNKRLELK